MTPPDEEDLHEQLLALRELVEGYRESHRSLFRQIKDVQANRDEVERHFWSVVRRLEERLAEQEPEDPREVVPDPFADLSIDTLPPVTRRASFSGGAMPQNVDDLAGELAMLRQENQALATANQELLWRIDELEKNEQAPSSVPLPDEQQLAAAREEARAEAARQFSADLARKERDLGTKNAELIRTSDQLRRASVDLELARGQMEEDAQEIATLHRKLEAAAQTIEGLRGQIASPRSSSRRDAPPSSQDRQDALERQVLEWAEKAQRQETLARDALQEIGELQLLAVRIAVVLGRATGRWESDPRLAAYRGLQLAFTVAGLSDDELARLTPQIFPFIEHPSQPHYEVGENEADTETLDDSPDTEHDHELIDEDELLRTPPPIAVEPPPSEHPTSRTSLRPPPLPSTPPPADSDAFGELPLPIDDPFAVPSAPPPDSFGELPLPLEDPFREPPLPAMSLSSRMPARRNQTVGWSPEVGDPFPSSRPAPSRNRIMLGFDAPDQLAEQRKLASEQDRHKKPRSGS